jgi:hypothetical protein
LKRSIGQYGILHQETKRANDRTILVDAVSWSDNLRITERKIMLDLLKKKKIQFLQLILLY